MTSGRQGLRWLDSESGEDEDSELRGESRKCDLRLDSRENALDFDRLWGNRVGISCLIAY